MIYFLQKSVEFKTDLEHLSQQVKNCGCVPVHVLKCMSAGVPKSVENGSDANFV